MPYFSKKSEKNMEGIHPIWIEILRKAIEIIDFRVDEGLRTMVTQMMYVEEGVSLTMDSQHLLGLAVDLYPCPLYDIDDINEYKRLAGVIQGVAAGLGYSVTWGGDWTKIVDCPHYQLEL